MALLRLFRSRRGDSSSPSSPPPLVLDLKAAAAMVRGKKSRKQLQHARENEQPKPLLPELKGLEFGEEAKENGKDDEGEGEGEALKGRGLEELEKERVMLDQAQEKELVELCVQQLMERGLDTLGLLRPYRISSSRAAQANLLHLFLAPHAPETHLSLSFEAPAPGPVRLRRELAWADVHDVGELLRWALAHAGQPLEAKAKEEVLNLVSSVAAHSEHNAMSGIRLARSLGYSVLGSRPSSSSFTDVYSTWCTAADAFQDSFLAFLSTQAQSQRLPVRLSELLAHPPAPRQLPLLVVELDLHYSTPAVRPAPHDPLALFARAVGADVPVTEGGEWDAWTRVKAAGVEGAIDEEWRRICGLVFPPSSADDAATAEEDEELLSPASLYPPKRVHSRRRSSSFGNLAPSPASPRSFGSPNFGASMPALAPVGEGDDADANADANANGGGDEWAVFSSAGFSPPAFVGGLNDRPLSPSYNPTSRTVKPDRRTMNASEPSPSTKPVPSAEAKSSAPPPPARIISLRTFSFTIDESFLDTYTSTVLPSSLPAGWAVLQLSPSSGPFQWLLLTEKILPPPPSSLSATTTSRAVSPTPSKSSRIGGGLRKRWSLFSAGSVRGRKGEAVGPSQDPKREEEDVEVLRSQDAPARRPSFADRIIRRVKSRQEAAEPEEPSAATNIKEDAPVGAVLAAAAAREAAVAGAASSTSEDTGAPAPTTHDGPPAPDPVEDAPAAAPAAPSDEPTASTEKPAAPVEEPAAPAEELAAPAQEPASISEELKPAPSTAA